MVSCLENIKCFKVFSTLTKDMKKQSLQEGIITFIVNFVRNNEDEIELQQSFKNLDLNGDGVLSQEELTEGMMKFLNIGKK
jgi:Ca2+-binding EF-hand superfamily protein